MEYDELIRSGLDYIDGRITENIRVEELARAAGYSVYHFCRLFASVTGTPVMAYVTRRKLEYALYDLSRGGRIIDVAMDYGFETHAGFTKAFKRHFGCPPSLYRLHVIAHKPVRATVDSLQSKNGGITMQVQIKEMQPFFVAGAASLHSMPNVKGTGDIPAFWNTVSMDHGKNLTRAYDAFAPAKHGEFALCLDIDENTGEFTYVLGVAFDADADETKIEPDMRKIEIPGGSYAVFTTPKVPNAQYPQSIADTWAEIITRWLPESPYEYDDARPSFEAYDERDHAWLHDNMAQMDICVPVKRG
ncbi:MAG: helix-turn-helix domain-containing protein [Oscillospiraceae bacterium]|jgi:AraC family transcriptional regulator|nr:helix-turn-helix domain-containing protein [Oscillospiraceae bacterium]